MDNFIGLVLVVCLFGWIVRDAIVRGMTKVTEKERWYWENRIGRGVWCVVSMGATSGGHATVSRRRRGTKSW